RQLESRSCNSSTAALRLRARAGRPQEWLGHSRSRPDRRAQFPPTHLLVSAPAPSCPLRPSRASEASRISPPPLGHTPIEPYPGRGWPPPVSVGLHPFRCCLALSLPYPGGSAK